MILIFSQLGRVGGCRHPQGWGQGCDVPVPTEPRPLVSPHWIHHGCAVYGLWM